MGADASGIDLDDLDLPEEIIDEWDIKFSNLKKSLKGEGDNARKYVSIYEYENIIKDID